PGYDDSRVQGRVPFVVPRENGALFARNWQNYLRFPSKLAVIETWNEYHEGTEIAASLEYGRDYIHLNRQFADWFKQGYVPPWPHGPYSDYKIVSVDLRATNVENGIVQFERADGVTTNATVGGIACRAMVPTIHAGRYIYFRVDDSFKWGTPMQPFLDIEYYDSAGGTFTVEYDGSNPNGAFRGTYSWNGVVVNLAGSGTWKTARFNLTDARFLRRQNGGGDFRIVINADQFYVRRVSVVRPTIPDEAGQVVRGQVEDFSNGLSTNWFVAGGNVFTVQNGALKIGPSSGTTNRLLWNQVTSTTNELLARIRINSFSPTNVPLGGICIAVNPMNGSGLSYQFVAPTSASRRMRLEDPMIPTKPETVVNWNTNTWYWLRLRHQPNLTSGAADLFARIWRADGQTVEPTTWQTWDYYPSYTLRSGYAGIIAPQNGELECDFILLKSDTFPETTVRLPGRKPAHATVSATRNNGFVNLQFTGEPGRRYQIESSTNLVHWNEVTPLVLTNGAAQFITAPRIPTFYRSRFLP
ncbi:MAG: hypothetical protein ACK4UN_17245, partial [Limisphaerales bacterium]